MLLRGTRNIDFNVALEKLSCLQIKMANQDDKSESLSNVVAEHYNQSKNESIDLRKNSRIFHLRNFNNWIKSMIIDNEIRGLKDSGKLKLRVLDLCCGKGGDIKKWIHGNVSHVIFVDIAATSIDRCKERYSSLPRHSHPFTAEFITADCTKVRVREKMRDVTMLLDLVSCQFAFHYCFESLGQAELMLKNASECLRPGGRFIGTMPNSAEIIRRVRSDPARLKNEIFSIELLCEEPYPLFGGKYDFKLDEVVDCPEFLVHFPTMVTLAKTFGLKLIQVKPLSAIYKDMLKSGRRLLNTMKALEPFPARDGQQMADAQHYSHVKDATAEKPVGTLSAPEWDVISLYLGFIFEKVERKSWDANGNPVYEL